MYTETKIALDCPYCGESIYETLDWFKKTYSTCPTCGKGLAADQFTAVIADLEQAIDASIEEMVHGTPHGGCCGNRAAGGSGLQDCVIKNRTIF